MSDAFDTVRNRSALESVFMRDALQETADGAVPEREGWWYVIHQDEFAEMKREWDAAHVLRDATVAQYCERASVAEQRIAELEAALRDFPTASALGNNRERFHRLTLAPVSLPFQVIERVNESRASREAAKERGATLFDVWEDDGGETFEDGWRNKLIWGDNLLVASALLSHFTGRIDLIYADPPFATGADFSFKTEVGEAGDQLFKEQSLIEERAYRDTWGGGIPTYIEMLASRLAIARDLLSDEGCVMVHVDWRVSHYVRLVMDELFGPQCFCNEIVWSYRSGGAPRKGYLPRKHDSIVTYSKSEQARLSPLKERQYLSKPFMGSLQDAEGRYYVDTLLRDVIEGEVIVVEDDDGLTAYNARPVLNLSKERLGYDTQKPEGLLRLLIRVATDPGDLVADFFVGSGTTVAAAEALGRRWVGCDLGRYAIHVTRKRMLDVADCRPFEVLNLGKYERQYWSVATFGEDLDEDGAISLLEYVAFILKLYGATPTSGSQHVHGRTGGALVHVGAIDAPVTFDEVMAAVAECVALKARELHVLGWEWEMGLNDLVSDEAKKQGIKVVLRQIPREVMEDEAARKGDVAFFELAYLEASLEPTKDAREYQVSLENFVIPNPELVPEDVREKIAKWSDYVDYWAVDWDFSDDTFMQGWVTYRTPTDRSLDLVSDPHVYLEPGEYQLMIKVIDVFGNDTSKLMTISVD